MAAYGHKDTCSCKLCTGKADTDPPKGSDGSDGDKTGKPGKEKSKGGKR